MRKISGTNLVVIEIGLIGLLTLFYLHFYQQTFKIHIVFEILISIAVMVGLRKLQKLPVIGKILNITFGLAHAFIAYFIINFIIFHDSEMLCGGLISKDPILFWTGIILLVGGFQLAHSFSVFELDNYNNPSVWSEQS